MGLVPGEEDDEEEEEQEQEQDYAACLARYRARRAKVAARAAEHGVALPAAPLATVDRVMTQLNGAGGR